MTVDFLVGDCLESLKSLPAKRFHCVVTSPPYFGLRDYDNDGQIGHEKTPAEFVAKLVEVFAEVHRVMRDDGVAWLNIGDSYVNNSKANTNGTGKTGLKRDRARTEESRQKTVSLQAKAMTPMRIPSRDFGTAKPKELLLVPQRLAIALQEWGWHVRQEIIWHKPNPMPESVNDRCTKAHEQIWMLTKKPKYFWDEIAMQEPGVWPAGTKGARGSAKRQAIEGVNARPPEYKVYNGMRNKRSVWTVTTKPFADAHFATFPPDLIEPAILASTSRRGCCFACGAPWQRIVGRPAPSPEVAGSELDRFGDGSHGVHRKVGSAYQKWLDDNPKQTLGWEPTCNCDNEIPFDFDLDPCRVLDPFGGAGTVGLVAMRHGLDATLCELNPDYVAMAKRRLGMLGDDIEAELDGLAADIGPLRKLLREWEYMESTVPF